MTRNRSGPKIEPCGTPWVRFMGLLVELFQTTDCDLPDMYDSIHFKGVPTTPNSSSCFLRGLNPMVSKAALKLMRFDSP